jgi:pimeloyl-ACP methyl ester carboxylesterase
MYDSVRKLAGAAALAPALTTAPFAAAAADSYQIHYENIVIDGVEIAYREAGDPARPTVLLLHGFPTSSQMFRNLIPELAARYHVLAPDYPGFGASAMPLVNDFDYSFGHFAELMTAFIDAKGVGR